MGEQWHFEGSLDVSWCRASSLPILLYSTVMQEIYLDYNATTPLLPEVVDAMASWANSGPANPASQHRFGRRARQRIEDCREKIGRILGADVDSRHADRVLFTSGGTEANNLALTGLGDRRAGCVVLSAIEHPSVAEVADHLATTGQTIERLAVNRDGVVQLDRLDDLLARGVRIVSLMLGNNETGVLQPVAEAAARCAAAGVPLHSDAVQAVGKIPVHFRQLGVAAMSVSAHKFHGPAGIGALVVADGADLLPSFYGGHQQQGLRPGTEPVMLVVGMCAALEAWQRDSDERAGQLRTLRDQFERSLLAVCPAAVVHAANAPRLPHTSCVAFPGVDRQAMVIALDLAGVACSTGSACSSGSSEPSPVLRAMGLPEDQIAGSLRFSFGLGTTSSEVATAVGRISQVYKDLREQIRGKKTVPPGTGSARHSI